MFYLTKEQIYDSLIWFSLKKCFNYGRQHGQVVKAPD